eukprot:CAMPEP_0113674968 /NCGR_PEP_ID=MMETSP0038_2-20120614/7736_1 /TAXON_ID=2898 /ORGANISM="Cryptomonas paramecium" /LENGTH=169 /DNA_ID=CAMNT_0000591653 /DNA_START=357 /DNA_END=862 /DNA_ORIENTATION=+ /assembly_acc=CAM_ASM_000170
MKRSKSFGSCRYLEKENNATEDIASRRRPQIIGCDSPLKKATDSKQNNNMKRRDASTQSDIECCPIPEPVMLPMVSVFFADIVCFTSLSAHLHPCCVAKMLHRLYSRFDALAKHHGVERVDIIGDAYFAATNLDGDQSSDHAARLARFALDVVAAAADTPVDPHDPGGP